MHYLVVSDLHANWEALEAVLDDAQGRYTRTICCGDVVGAIANHIAATDRALISAFRVIEYSLQCLPVGVEIAHNQVTHGKKR